MIVALFAGCGRKAENPEEQTIPATTQETANGQETAKEQETTAQDEPSQDGSQTSENEDDGYPLTVTDATGFEMTIEKKPVQIVSLTLGTDEILVDMVDKSRIKSVTKYADDPGVSNIVDKVKDIPLRTSTEVEQVISRQPDLVFTDTWASAEFVQQLRDAGITVYVFKTPNNIEEQKQVILEIAHVVGEEEKGRELVDWMDKKLKEIEEKVKNIKHEDRLVILDYSEMGTTSAKGTNFDDIVTHAGLRNAATEAGMEGWPVMPKELIVELNPDALVLPSWYYTEGQTLESFKKSILEDKSLQTVKAVQDQRFIVVPHNHLTAISHYVVLGVEDMAKAAYPELFE